MANFNSGIYMILNTANNKSYIGSSKHLDRRFKEHLRFLKNNKHYNNHLQRSWNKYNEDKFQFWILENCNTDVLIERENYFIEKYNTLKEGYNMCMADMSIFSEEHKKKISESKMGHVVSEETRKKLSHYTKKQKWNKICVICENNFIGNSGNAKFCSDLCKSENNKIKSEERNNKRRINRKRINKQRKPLKRCCKWCENIFYGSHKVYNYCEECSEKIIEIKNDVSDIYNLNKCKVSVTCKWCGWKYKAKASHNYFCYHCRIKINNLYNEYIKELIYINRYNKWSVE